MKIDFLKTKKLSGLSILYSLLVMVMLSLAGCSGSVPKNEAGWYQDFEGTVKIAKKSGKNIMVLFSRDDRDINIKNLKERIFDTPEFFAAFSDDYEFCNLDFSGERFKKVKSDGKKLSAKEKKQNDRDMRTAVIYGMTTTPAILLMSPQGYVITDISYIPGNLTLSDFQGLVNSYSDEIKAMSNYVKALKLAHGLEKVTAIDLLFEETSTNYRYALNDLIYSVPKLDPKDESGLVGKYILAAASSESVDCYLNRHPEKTVDVYLKTAKSKYLNTPQKQQCYFAAAYVSRSNDNSVENSEKIISYLEQAVALDSESPIGVRSAEMIEREAERLARYKEIEARKKAEGAQE